MNSCFRHLPTTRSLAMEYAPITPEQASAQLEAQERYNKTLHIASTMTDSLRKAVTKKQAFFQLNAARVAAGLPAFEVLGDMASCDSITMLENMIRSSPTHIEKAISHFARTTWQQAVNVCQSVADEATNRAPDSHSKRVCK